MINTNIIEQTVDVIKQGADLTTSPIIGFRPHYVFKSQPQQSVKAATIKDPNSSYSNSH